MRPEKLEQYRKILGLSQNQMAYRIGIHRKTYLTYEAGTSKIPRSMELLLGFIFEEKKPILEVVSKKKKTQKELMAEEVVKKLAPYLVNLESRLTEMKCEMDGIKQVLMIDAEEN